MLSLPPDPLRADPLPPSSAPVRENPPSLWMQVPRRRPRFGLRSAIAYAVLRLFGWKPEGDPPDLASYLIVAAPHTALADGFWMNAFAWYWGVKLSWLVKRSLVRSPFGRWLPLVGAVPVDRSSAHGLVGDLVEQFRARKSLVLCLSPEGTRQRADYWKSGFYYIALEAGVPICLSYLDYGKRRGGFGPCFTPSGNPAQDMPALREFYADATGKIPAWFTPPRLREEAEESAKIL